MFDFFIRLVENSVVMSLAIIILLLITFFTRGRAGAKARFAAWVIVAVGLLLPVRPALWTVQVPEAVTAPQAIFTMPQVEIEYEGVSSEIFAWYTVESTTSGISTVSTVESTGSQSTITQATPQSVNLRHIAVVVWLTGVSVFLLFYAVRHFMYMKRIHRFANAATGAHETLKAVCSEVGLRRMPRLLVCPLTPTPVTAGLIRPVIILPNEDEDGLYLSLLHEVIHLKRRDIFIRAFTLFAAAIHWFNPLVYILLRRVNTEAELATDAAVLRHAGDDARMDYAGTILSAARRTQTKLAFAAALSGEGKNLKRRLSEIIEKKHTRRGLALLCAALMIGGVILAATMAVEREAPMDEDGNFIEYIGISETEEDAEPPYIAAPIEIEESGGRLVIYLPDGNNFGYSRLISAINIFRTQNPDVEVILERIGSGASYSADYEAYIQRVSAEMMAGGGPDIVLAHLFDDIHGIMNAGMLRNLSDFYHRDPHFTARDEVHPAIMDAGLFRGRRYVIPISFNMPLHLGQHDRLIEAGIDPDAELDIITFLQTLEAASAHMEENPLFHYPAALRWWFSSPTGNLGVPIIDHERGVILPYPETLRSFIEMYEPLRRREMDRAEEMGAVRMRANSETMLYRGNMLYISHGHMSVQILFDMSFMKMLEREWSITSLRDNHGQLYAVVTQSLAVNANSPNYENAWRFIRFMLESGRQSARIGGAEAWGLGGGMPVNTVALMRQVMDTMRTPEDIGTAEGVVRGAGLDDEDRMQLVELLEGINYAILPNRLIDDMYREIFYLYLEGAISLDDAMETLEQRLRLYLTE